MKKYIVYLLVFTTLSVPFSAHGLSFNPELIISDEDFFSSEDMSREEVQWFLERKNSTLATYRVPASDGTARRASDVIWESAQSNGLNPKVLLVLLQKEQSLIENPHPSQYSYDWATGYARCDACPASHPAVAAYKGFSAQVEKAAWRKKYYTTHPYEFTYQEGLTSNVDGMTLTPQNRATAALYNYTPHLRGNFSFWKLWQRYFGKAFPDGMLIKEDGSPNIWLIADGNKRRVTSMSVLRSRYAERNVAYVSRGSLNTYPEGTPVRFMQYSLLQVPTGGIYLIADDGKFIIPSREVFRHIGFNALEIEKVNEHDLDDIPTLGILSKEDSPLEELVQDPKNGGVFLLTAGAKHPLFERALLETNFSRTPIRRAVGEELAKAPLREPVLFRDGSLIKGEGDPTVYIISHGMKRPFTSEEAFLSLGFSWDQIVATSGHVLALHQTGEPVDVGRIIEENYEETVLPPA
ncbi:MAG: hypothetical protein AAB855_04000 [Patescibacteria group bacterium]